LIELFCKLDLRAHRWSGRGPCIDTWHLVVSIG